MDQRASLSRGWILLAIGLVVTVGAVGYYLGANHAFGQPVAVMRPGFGHGVFGVGFLGFWLPVLVLAILIGILVAATARPGGRTETFEEWHRRAHGEGATASSEAGMPTQAGTEASPTEDTPPPR